MTTAALPSTGHDEAFTSDSSGAILRRRAAEIGQSLAILLRLYRLHDPANDAFEVPVARLRESIARTLAAETSLRLECHEGDFFANGVRIRTQLKNLSYFRELERVLERHSLGGLLFSGCPDRRELMALIALLIGSSAEGDPLDGVNRALRADGITDLLALPRLDRTPGDPNAPARRALRAYQEALDLIREYMAVVDSPARFSARRAKRAVQKLVDLSREEGTGFSLAGLAALRSHDEYTLNHMVNVCVIAISFGQRLGLGRTQLARLGLCALYHDMGKLHVPDSILNKCGPLTDEEWALMGNHTVYAARSLFPLLATDLDTLPRIVTALQHHLRYDGKGYPKLRVLKQQSLYAQITSIADSYDAMTTLRVYSKARLPHEALQEIVRGAGSQFDPFLARAFVSCMGIYPVGAAARLRNGDLAVVCECNPDPARAHQPRVVLVTRSGTRLHDERVMLDLSRPGMDGAQIDRCIDPERADINCAHYLFGTAC